MVISNTRDGSTVITLLPNRSASWEETRFFALLICGTTLAVGVFWAFVGAWAVLPFSGLEAGLVAWLLYRVCQRTYQRQVITLDNERVLVQFGSRFPQRSWQLDREDTHLAVAEPAHHLDAITLQIFDRRHSIELGGFLNKEDRREALRRLKEAGLYVRGYAREGTRPI